MKLFFTWALACAAVAGVFWGPPTAQIAALAAAILAAAITDYRSLRAVLRIGLLLTVLFSSAVAGAVVAWSTTWEHGIEQGTGMLFRLLVLVTLTTLLARNVDSENLLRISRRLGMQRFGLVFGLALNVLPHLVSSTRQVVIAWRVRRRASAGPTPSPLTLLEVLLAHVARIADDAAAAAALRGHAALQQRPKLAPARTPVIVATGKTGSGKTTAILEVIHRLRGDQHRFVGFVQPGRFEQGQKTGFGIRDLTTGEESEFARLVERKDGQFGTRFRFFDAGIELARQALSSARPGDILIIDELGPMELRGEGHMDAVQTALETPHLCAVVVVVRAHLVPSLLATLEAEDAKVVEVTSENGAQKLEELLNRRSSRRAPLRSRNHRAT